MPAVSPADLALTTLLVVALPGYMMARSIARRGVPDTGDRVRRYHRTIVTAALPCVMLGAIWLVDRRAAAALGLGRPDRAGWILLGVAVALIAMLGVLAPRTKIPKNPERNATAMAMVPVGARETLWFLVFAVAVGAGWELLYRGYLLWALAPPLGVAGAVAVMALSYGVAHGYRSPRALAGSIASAVLFAAGYALSHSLWWLIVIHIGLPLAMLVTLRPRIAA